MREVNRTPGATYPELIQRVRDHFGCGQTAAEQSYKSMRLLERQAMANLDVSSLLSKYWDLYERAARAGKFNTARGILDSIAWAADLVKKPQVDVNVTGVIAVEHRAHVAVLHMTPAQRIAKERELLERAEAARAAGALPVIDVGSPDEDGTTE